MLDCPPAVEHGIDFQVSGPLFAKAIEGPNRDLGLVVIDSFIRRVVALYKPRRLFFFGK